MKGMKKILAVGVILGLVLMLVPFAPGAVKPTVIVVGFDITVPGLEYEETLPAALTDLMINALINSNRFRVFERRKLDALVAEQGFQHFSGLVDPSTAVQLGRMIGAHFVVTGSITDISRGGGGGVRLGPVGFGESSVRVTLTVRIVDVATGEILYSVVEKKKSTRSQVNLGIGGIEMYSRTSQDVITTVGAMCEKIVADFVAKMDAGGLTDLADIPLQGYVVEVSGKTIYLNLGKNSGIKVGDAVRVLKPGKAIVDPKTGEVLDQELTPIAEGRVMGVRDRVSEVALLRTREAVEKEYLVEVVNQEEIGEILSEEGEATEISEGTEVETTAETESSMAEKEEEAESIEVSVAEESTATSNEMPQETTFSGKPVLYEREFYPDGKPKLEYTYYEENGQKIEHGTYTKWYENGKVMIQGTYQDGKREGIWREYFRDGVLKAEGPYVGGKREGAWVVYYESGNTHWEGSYVAGEKEGLWIEFVNSKEGKKFTEVEYKKGKEVPDTFRQYDAYGNVVKTK